MKKILSALIILILSVSGAYADQITKAKLPSGQSVIVKEIHTNPIVMIDTWVKTGSIDENDENNGVAHFLEHLFFKGSKNYPNNEFDKILESKGALTNAATSKDFTHFHILIPSKDFETALKLHSDMLTKPLFPRVEIDKERQVVIREIERSNDNPSRILNNNFYKALYPTHPYRREVLGTKEIISTIPREEIFKFYYNNYAPENLITVIVGDVDSKQVIKQVEKYFENTQTASTAKRVSHKQDKHPEKQININSKEDVKTSSMIIGYKCGLKVTDKDSYVLDILATVLGDGKSSRFYKEIKDEKQLVQGISANHVSMKEDSVFVIGSSLNEADINSAKESIFEGIEKVKKDGITQEELLRAKKAIERSTLYSRESVTGNASEIGYSTLLTGNWNFSEEYMKNMKKVTAKEVQKAAKKYLDSRYAIIATITPKNPQNEGKTEKITYQKSEKIEKNNSAKLFKPTHHNPVNCEKFGKIKRYTLSNGAILIIDKHQNNEIVAIDIKVKGGNYVNKPIGLATITAAVMDEGTEKYPKTEFAETAEENGIQISASAEKEYFNVSMQCTKPDMPLGLDMLNQVVNKARLDDADIQKTKQSAIYSIIQNRDNAANVVFEELSHALWKNTAYDTTGKSVEKYIPQITKQDVENCYKNIFDAENTIIAVSGDVNEQEMVNYFSEILNAKGTKKVDYSVYKDEFSPLEENTVLTKNQGKEAAWVVLAWQTDGLTNKKDRAALRVINAILGSGMSSRLFSEVRAQKGLAYAVGSTFSAYVNKGSFCVYIGTEPSKAKEAENAMMYEVERMKKEFVTDKELEDAKTKLKGEAILKMETNASKAHFLSVSEQNGSGVDYYYDKFNEEIDSVTVSDVITTANKYFSRPYVLSKVLPKK